MRMQRASLVGIAVLLAAGSVLAETIPNWSAPATWTPPKGHMTASAMSDLAGPAPFIPVTPCRVADTRGNGFTGAYGPPALAGGSTRTFVIGGQCGIPTSALAVSFNFTILSITTAGDIRVYPDGATMPLVSTQNWIATTGVIANAAVTPLGATNGITVHVDGLGTINLIIDVNGYYAQSINSPEYLGIYGNLSGGVIYGYNGSTSGASTSGVRGVVPNGGAGASGVLGEYGGSAGGYGVEGNSVTVGNAAGVIGRDQASTPVPFDTGHSYIAAGVRGESGNGLAVLGLSNYMAGAFQNYDTSNNETASAYVAWAGYGVYAQSYVAADGVAGVYGSAMAGSNVTYGVLGSTSSTATNAAAVKGTAGAPVLGSTNYVYAGVRGEGGPNSWGTLGISNNIGAAGYHLNSSTGAIETQAWLASSSTTAIYGSGNMSVTGTKSFVEPYPADPTKEIKYVALEGPEAGTYFRGKGRIVGGQAIVEVPDTFRMVTDEDGLTVQVTPIGRSVSLSVVSYDLNAIVVEGTRDAEFFYLVQGVRKSFKDFQPVQENVDYKPMAATDQMPTALATEQKRTLIRAGVYNEDGTVNMDTAERLGWAREWRERDEKLKASAEATSAKLVAKTANQTESTRQP
jgi:hypothetical protein